MNYPHFLDPKPKGQDKFDSKSQQRLVNSIADYMIQNDDAENKDRIVMPRIIGIEGEWGSGKSNVIEMLSNSPLKADYNFYIYNAWGNQEDLQRRSILEGLTNRLVNDKGKDLLPEKTKVELRNGDAKTVSWKERLKYLLASKKEVETDTIPQLCRWIILIILAIVFAPICTNLAKGFENIKWLSIVFLLIPILMILIGYFIAVYKEHKRKGEGSCWDRALSNMLRLYKGKEVHENKFETISSEEPTVEEFRNWMKDISNGLIEKDDNQKVVIVFDDMDRLPAEKVKRLWSTIHTFFAGEGFERIWVIIPFDRKHLANAFEDSTANQVIDYFIQKTFPVVYRVAPPLKKDYDTVFMSYIKDAFGDSESLSDLETVDRFYRLSNSKPNVRAIMSFINELVSLRQQWDKGEIPITHIAAYLIGKKEISENPSDEILSGKYLGPLEQLINNDIELQNSVAALYYGVGVSDALQIPLEEYIMKCIDNPENDINTYSENKNFIFDLGNVINSVDLTKIGSTIAVVSNINSKQLVPQSIWANLIARKREAGIHDQNFDGAYKILLKHTSEEFQQRVLDNWYNALYYFKDFKGEKYHNALAEAQKFIDENKLECKIPVRSKVLTTQQFIDFIKVGGEDYKKWQVVCNPDELDTYLSDLSKLDYSMADSLKNLLDDKDYKFDKLLKAIQKAYAQPDSFDYNNAGTIILAYRNTSERETLDYTIDHTKINNLYSAIQTNKVFDEEHGRSDLESMKLCLGDTNIVIDDNTNIEKIAELTDYYKRYDELLIMATSSSYTLLRNVVKDKIEKKNGVELSLNKILPIFEKIISVTGITVEQLLSDLTLWFSNQKDDLDKVEIEKLIPSTVTFPAILADKSELAQYLCKDICIKLATIPTDTLYNNRTTPTYYWLQAINVFIGSNYLKVLPQNATEFCALLLVDLCKATSFPSTFPEYQQKLFANVDANQITTQIRNIRDMFCNGTITMTAQKFKFFEEWLRNYGELDKWKTDVCDKIIAKVITDSECCQIILTHDSFYIGIINATNSSALKAQMTSLLKDSKNERFIRFAKECGYEVKKKEEKVKE